MADWAIHGLVNELNRSNPYDLCPSIKYPVKSALSRGAAGLMSARACHTPLLRSKLVCKNKLCISLPYTVFTQLGYLGWPTLFAAWRKLLRASFPLSPPHPIIQNAAPSDQCLNPSLRRKNGAKSHEPECTFDLVYLFKWLYDKPKPLLLRSLKFVTG